MPAGMAGELWLRLKNGRRGAVTQLAHFVEHSRVKEGNLQERRDLAEHRCGRRWVPLTSMPTLLAQPTSPRVAPKMRTVCRSSMRKERRYRHADGNARTFCRIELNKVS